MNGVIGMTGLLLDTGLTDEQREYAEIVRKSGETLLSLINDILDFSKIEARKLDLEILDFDLATVVEDTAEMLAVKAQEKDLELACLIDPDVPAPRQGRPRPASARCSRTSGATPSSSPMRETWPSRSRLLKRRRRKPTVRFEVRDTGIGIPQGKSPLFSLPLPRWTAPPPANTAARASVCPSRSSLSSSWAARWAWRARKARARRSGSRWSLKSSPAGTAGRARSAASRGPGCSWSMTMR